MKTLLYPMGRIGQVAFRNAALFLIAIGACFSLLPLLLPERAMLSYISVVLIYP
jgi:hypothetical protein